MKIMADKRKELDDTDLAWYGLTEEDIEKIKEKKTYTSEEVDKILYVRDLFAKQWIYIDDFDKFEKILEGLEMYNDLKHV